MKKNHNIESYKNILKNIFTRFAEIPESHLEEFANIFSIVEFKKKDFIILPNSLQNNKAYFIIDGLVRIYYLAENKEITSDFKENNSFFVNGFTLFTGIPNVDYYQALEDTVCMVTDFEAFEILTKKYHSIEHLGRKIIEKYYSEAMRVSYNYLFLNADERYAIFMKERQGLINKVSLKYIASYLGIAQETLSRLRAKDQLIKT